MRLFAAIVPPQPVLAHLEGALDLARSAPGPWADDRGPAAVRWTPAEDRHLTVAFYGEVPEGATDDLAENLALVARGRAPFRLWLHGAGVFDRRTLWIGCGGDTAALAELSDAASDAGGDVLGRRDPRERSRGHLTIARVRGFARGRPGPGGGGRRDGGRVDGGRRPPSVRAGTTGPATDVAALAHALAVYRGPDWAVESFALVASELGAGPGGAPRHRTVARFELGAVAG